MGPLAELGRAARDISGARMGSERLVHVALA